MLFAGMASGTSTIHHPNLGADCRATLDALHGLGCTSAFVDRQTQLSITSPGVRGWARSGLVHIDCRNSGTTARLLMGILASCPGVQARIDGDASLRRRPMRRVVEPLRAMGASITTSADAAANDDFYLPLLVQGKQLSAAHVTSKIPSAQVKSALLLAALACKGPSSVRMPLGSRDHTERMLRAAGVDVLREVLDGCETLQLNGPASLGVLTCRIPADPSAAAFWVVWSLLHGRALELPGILQNEQRTQYLQVLQRMGAKFAVSTDAQLSLGDITGTIALPGTAAQLTGVDVDAQTVASCIDELPILAVAAAFAEGETRLRGCGELRHKESDRLAGIVDLLRVAGADVAAEGDDLFVAGGLRQVPQFTYVAQRDHRLVMAAAILGTRAAQPPMISDQSEVAVSYPGFFDVLASLR